MTYSAGKDGELWIGASATAPSARVKSWSISASQETIDTTFLGDTDRTFTQGVRSMTGQCEIAYYSDQNGESDATTLINLIFKERTTSSVGGVAPESSVVQLKLGFKNYLGTLQYITVNALFTSMSITCSQGEIFTASGSFTVQGAPTAVSI